MPDQGSSPQSELTFEQALARLEQIVRDLEAGDIDLQAALGRFEQGCRLIKQCHDFLGQAERQIELLVRLDEEGTAVREPFEEGSSDLEEKSRTRAARRGATVPDAHSEARQASREGDSSSPSSAGPEAQPEQ